MTWRDFGALHNILTTCFSPIPEKNVQTHYSRLAGCLPHIQMSVNALVYRVDAGRVIATWSRDALQDAIVETVLEAGQITIRKLLTIADILIEILLAKIQ